MGTEVAECSVARFRALVECDFAQLSTLLAEELRYVHATGVSHDRMAYLRFLREQLTFLGVRLDSRVVRESGDIAVVTGLLVQHVVRAGESQPVTLSSWATEVWRRHDGLRLISFQSTRLPT